MSKGQAQSPRGSGENNTPTFENKVTIPAHAPTAASSRGGDTNVSTFENRVTASES